MWGGLPSLTLLATLCPQAPAAGVGVAGGGARRAAGGGDERARRSGPGRAALEDSLRSSAPSPRPSPRASDQRKQADPLRGVKYEGKTCRQRARGWANADGPVAVRSGKQTEQGERHSTARQRAEE